MATNYTVYGGVGLPREAGRKYPAKLTQRAPPTRFWGHNINASLAKCHK